MQVLLAELRQRPGLVPQGAGVLPHVGPGLRAGAVGQSDADASEGVVTVFEEVQDLLIAGGEALQQKAFDGPEGDGGSGGGRPEGTWVGGGREGEGLRTGCSAGGYHRGNNLRGFFLGRAKIRGRIWNWSLEMKKNFCIRSLAVAS